MFGGNYDLKRNIDARLKGPNTQCSLQLSGRASRNNEVPASHVGHCRPIAALRRATKLILFPAAPRVPFCSWLQSRHLGAVSAAGCSTAPMARPALPPPATRLPARGPSAIRPSIDALLIAREHREFLRDWVRP